MGLCMCVSGGREIAEHAQSPDWDHQHRIYPGIVAHACNTSPWEVEAGGSEVPGHLELHSCALSTQDPVSNKG